MRSIPDGEILEGLWHRMMDARLRLGFARRCLLKLIHESPLNEVSSSGFHLVYQNAVQTEILALEEFVRVRRIYGKFLLDRVTPID